MTNTVWVLANSPAYRELLRGGYIVVGSKTRGKVLWTLMATTGCNDTGCCG